MPHVAFGGGPNGRRQWLFFVFVCCTMDPLGYLFGGVGICLFVCVLALFHVFMMMNMGLHREPGEQSTQPKG